MKLADMNVGHATDSGTDSDYDCAEQEGRAKDKQTLHSGTTETNGQRKGRSWCLDCGVTTR